MPHHSNSRMKSASGGLGLSLLVVLLFGFWMTQVKGSFVLTSKLFPSSSRTNRVSAQAEQELNQDERLYFEDGLTNSMENLNPTSNIERVETQEKVETRGRDRRSTVTLVGRLPEPSGESSSGSNEMNEVQRDNRKKAKSVGDYIEEELSKLDFVGPLRLMLNQVLHTETLSALRKKKMFLVPDELKSSPTTSNHLPRQKRESDQAQQTVIEENDDLRGPIDTITSVLQQVFHSALQKWIKTVATLRERVALRIIKITAFEDTFHLSEALSNFNITRHTPLFLIAGGIRANITEALPGTFTTVPLDQLLQYGEEAEAEEKPGPKEAASLTSDLPAPNDEHVATLELSGSDHPERDLESRPSSMEPPPFHTVPDWKDEETSDPNAVRGHGVVSKETKTYGAARETDVNEDDEYRAEPSGNNPNPTTTTSTTTSTTEAADASSASLSPATDLNTGNGGEAGNNGETGGTTTEAEAGQDSALIDALKQMSGMPEIQARSDPDDHFFMRFLKQSPRQGRSQQLETVPDPEVQNSGNLAKLPEPQAEIQINNGIQGTGSIEISDVLINDAAELSTDDNGGHREKRSAGCPLEHEAKMSKPVGIGTQTRGLAGYPMYYDPANGVMFKPKPSTFNFNSRPPKSKYTINPNTFFPESSDIGPQPNFTLVIIPRPVVQKQPHHVSDSLTQFVQTLSSDSSSTGVAGSQ